MSNKVIFLDFDGPMIPLRAYHLPNQTKPFVTVFDPVAVSLVNKLAENHAAKIAVHSFWRRIKNDHVKDLKEHMLSQGIKEEHLHDDWELDFRFSSSRWHDITSWLFHHPETTNFCIIEDEACPDVDLKPHHVPVDFDEGFIWTKFDQANRLLNGNKPL